MIVVTAVHTFVAEHGDELDFQAGEQIEVLEKDEAFGDGWWRGRNTKGQEGLFPATYITDANGDVPNSAPASPPAVSPPSPKATTPLATLQEAESPRGTSTGVMDTITSGLGAASIGVANVMGKTIGEIENAIDSIAKPDSEDEQELGIGQNARARLAQQAKIANDQRDRQRVSGTVTGLVYSDESDDEAPKKPALLESALPTTPEIPSKPEPPAAVSDNPPSTWTVAEVVSWAKAKGFDESVWGKFQEHEISGDLLLGFDANLLKELEIPQFGKRMRIAQAIGELGRSTSPSSRGMSAPPSTVITQSMSPPGTPEDSPYMAWSHGRKSSTTPMESIVEGQRANSKPSSTKSGLSAPASPVPPSPATPASTAKRESTGSIGHKKKQSVDSKERLSFFGRNRKPAPVTPSGGTLGVASTQIHRIQPATPESIVSTNGTAAVMKQIGKPDHSGYLKKRGERYGWNTRFFVLKGNHLYWMKDEHEDRVKGHVTLSGHRVIVDENTNPGSYGFRLVGLDKTHSFSSSEQTVIREWMKALMKATIARDYTVPVTSSCNIPTIPLAEAQALSPRPPSPATRDATQRATRRENTNQLTAHDASILMSLDTSKRQSQLSPIPSRPIRDNRRPSAAFDNAPLIQWVNDNLPPPYPKASSLPESFVSGEVVFLLVRHLSGIEPNPPVPPSAFSPENDGKPGLEGLFAMMDMLIDAGIDTAGVTLNEVRQGDVPSITKLIENIMSWQESGVAK